MQPTQEREQNQARLNYAERQGGKRKLSRAKTQVYLMFFQRAAAYLKAAKQIKGSARRTEIQISTNESKESTCIFLLSEAEIQ